MAELTAAPYVPRRKNRIEKYGLFWSPTQDPVAIEMYMIQKGGQWEHKGRTVGLGLFRHFMEFESLLWPHKKWHKWTELILHSYLENRSIGCMGPASCVAGHTRIENPVTGECSTIKELFDGKIAPTVMTLNGPAKATVPFIKGFTDLYEVTLSNGNKFTCTSEHKLLTSDGFMPLASCGVGTLLCGYAPYPHRSNGGDFQTARISGALRWKKIIQDSQSDCRTYSCSCDEPPLPDGEFFRYASPLPVGAQECRECVSVDLDDSDNKPPHIHPYQHIDPLSIPNDLDQVWKMETPASLRDLEGIFSHGVCWSLLHLQSPSTMRLLSSFSIPPHSSDSRLLNFSLASIEYKVQPVSVSSIRWTCRDYFYDLQVPNHHHYFAEGAVHHNSGKSFSFATDSLADYYCFADCTTVMVCSTTREMLEQRIWGEVKKHHMMAKRLRSWIPGFIKESRQRIVTASKDSDVEGIDVRNGFLGVPCKKGNDYVGLGDFAGVKNKRVRLIADELHLLPRVFVDAISNLDKNPDFKAAGLGNPKDTTDALGIMCEPAADLGGWDGGIDQTPGTKAWKTRRPNGVCIQLPGSDSPNLKGDMGIPLITQADIDRDVAFYGTDSIWVTMMDEGKMPRGQGSRRVLTRNMAIKNKAMEQPVWRSSNRTRIACVDAAYKGVGGDRCVYAEMEFGDELNSYDPEQDNQIVEVLINQDTPKVPKRPIIALLKTEIIPIQANSKEESEEQIVNFVREHCEASGIPPEKFFFDSGMRTGLVSCFGRLWSPYVVSIDCGGSASEKPVSEQIPMACMDYYFNYITEMWYSVRHIVESGQFRGMTEDVLGEFCQREWGLAGKNKIQVEPKADMKKKIGRSPDLADCIAMGIEGARRLGFVIRNLGKQVQASTTVDWLKGARDRARKAARNHELTY